jgi:hypothetical protein
VTTVSFVGQERDPRVQPLPEAVEQADGAASLRELLLDVLHSGLAGVIEVWPTKTIGTTTRTSTPRTSTSAACVRPRRGSTRRRIGLRQMASTTAQPISSAKGCTTFHMIQATSSTVP